MRDNLAKKNGGKGEVFPAPIAFTRNPFDEIADEEGPVAGEAGGFEDIVFDATRIDIESIIALTARLSQVLAQEADYLSEMRIKEVGALQAEKLQLLNALEAQKRFLERNSNALDRMSDEECLELAQIVEIFQAVLRENHRRLLVAREVNRQVVAAIAETVHDAARNGVYDERGKPDRDGRLISMTYNQTI